MITNVHERVEFLTLYSSFREKKIRYKIKNKNSKISFIFYRCTVHFGSYKVHTPTNALFINTYPANVGNMVSS